VALRYLIGGGRGGGGGVGFNQIHNFLARFGGGFEIKPFTARPV
jgi:hypothetical protein